MQSWLAISNLSANNIHDKKGLSIKYWFSDPTIYIYIYIRVREIGAACIIHNESCYRATLKKQCIGHCGERDKGGVLLFSPPLGENTAIHHVYTAR
jgi:hypothetical protein